MNTLVFITLAVFIVAVNAQSFSIGIGLGGSKDAVIPEFDSQRSHSGTSASRDNPFLSFGTQPFSRSREDSALRTFEDFFSSSRVATLNRPSSKSRSSSRSPSSQTTRTPSSVSPVRRVPAPIPTFSFRASTLSTTPLRQPTTPAPTTVANPLRESLRRTTASNIRSSPSAGRESLSSAVRSTPDLSSRGRTQEEVIIPVTRPPTTTETEVIDVRDNLVGQSVCVRGVAGDACRQHLAITAMACATGFCQQCQQCGTVSPDMWPKCCREHFLCCRPLAKSCQACDQPLLQPFCGAAFGRCN